MAAARRGVLKKYSYVKCIECSNSYLMRDGDNPIVAICKKKNDREVANSVRICDHFKRNPFPAVLHQMITISDMKARNDT